MSDAGHNFHHLNCLGHVARILTDNAVSRGDAYVLVHVNGLRNRPGHGGFIVNTRIALCFFLSLLVATILTGCIGNRLYYKCAPIDAVVGTNTISNSVENITEGGVQANAKANAVENLGVNK